MATRWHAFAKNVALFATWYIPVFVLCFAGHIGWPRATAWAFSTLGAGAAIGFLAAIAICRLIHCESFAGDAKDRGDE